MASHPNGPPPFFASARAPELSQAAVAKKRNALNLDDIFGDVVFTPDGDTIFLSEQAKEEEGILNSGETEFSTMASKATADGKYAPVQQGGGLYTTQLAEGEKLALAMGAAAPGVQQTEAVPFRAPPQLQHHLQYAAPKSKKKGDRSSKADPKVDRR
jgi:hypothetical protein